MGKNSVSMVKPGLSSSKAAHHHVQESLGVKNSRANSEKMLRASSIPSLLSWVTTILGSLRATHNHIHESLGDPNHRANFEKALQTP
ncbi:hypothetical protein CRG98_014304 [Punica granatum]|uniref:Uncharacterized protein n=1 Tax=Punica granatum TaxID=22663 RepID=A0A2I0KBX2_PUNGR|nr:hypothetical protein CRG98_014304 [Punica granatum]